MGSLPGFLLWRLATALSKTRAPAPGEKPVDADGSSGVRHSHRDRFLVGEPLWSLLPAADQDLLRSRFGFEALRWGRVTAATLFVVGAANALASAAAFAAGLGGVVDGLWLAAGLALCGEQVFRWGENRLERPRGSALGWIVRPLARPLLSPRPN